MKLALRLIGGCLLGSNLGAAVAFGIILALAQFYSGEERWFLVGLLTFGVPTCAIGGGIAGAILAFRLRRSRWGAWTAGVGYALGVAFLVYSFVHEQRVQKRTEQRQRREAQERQDRFDQWGKLFAARYPCEESSLEELLGPLLYPDARFVEWTESAGRVPVWTITVESSDPLPDVLSYFMSVVRSGVARTPNRYARVSAQLRTADYPDGTWRHNEGPASYSCLPQRGGDGLETEIQIEPQESTVRILYWIKKQRFASRRWKTPEDLPPAWPKDLSYYTDRVAKSQQEDRIKIEQMLGELFYPGSRLICGGFYSGSPYVREKLFATSDQREEVVRYFESRYGPAKQLRHDSWFESKDARGTSRNVFVYSLGDRVLIEYF